MIWDIKPFVGLGPVAFSMTPIKVATAANLGVAKAGQDGLYYNEFRGIHTPVFNYLEGRLAIISTNHYMDDVHWRDLDVYATEPRVILQNMQKENGAAIRVLDTLIFENLGLQLTGFYLFDQKKFFDPDSDGQDDRVLSLWTRAAQAQNLKDLAPNVQHAPTL